MTINWKIIFGGVYLFIGLCIETSLGQVTCKSYSLVQLPGAMPVNGVSIQNTGRSACESSCLNYASGGCYGFTWSNNICTLNTQSADSLYNNVSSSVDYYHLIRAYSDCNAAGSCSYVWSGVKNQHGSGATNANVNSLSDCIKFCQGSSSCAAFDWNAVDKSCWTYTNAPTTLYPADYVHLFSKNCTIPPTATQQSSTALPSRPPLSSSSRSSSSTRPAFVTVACKPYSLVQIPGAMPVNGVSIQNTGRSACESTCLNYASGGCYGFTWSNNICTLNTQSADALYHNVSSSVDYYHLIRAYSDCNAAGSCSYVWSGVKNQHGSGASNANVNNLSDCIKFCQGSSSCAAFNWNAVDKSCWTYTNVPTDLYRADYLYFFRKNCTTQQSSTTLPTTRTLSSSSTSSSSTRTTNISVTCKPYSLVQLPGAMPVNGVSTQNTGRSACESSCLNDASCYGFTWSNNICTLNTQSADALYHNVSSSVDYYHLIRAYSDCNAARTCSYVWSGVKNEHGSGATNANVNSLSDCIKFCQSSSSCAAFDWNAVDKSCWTYTNAPTALYPADYVYLFRKNCTIPPTATQQSSTTISSYRPPLSSSTSSSSNRTTTIRGGFAVRLNNSYGNNSREGRLEIFYQGRWGTVCDDAFTDANARVACASLGFGHIGVVIGNRHGAGSDPIWLDDVNCTGNESGIDQCPHRPWGEHNCGHGEDVSISCVCGTRYFSEPTETISSPNYPTTYTNSLDCYSYIIVSSGGKVSITFPAFKTEPYYDWVTITCSRGNNFTSSKYSGSQIPAPLTISSCILVNVTFHTDGSVIDTGFKLQYSIISSP